MVYIEPMSKWRVPAAAYAIFDPEGNFLFFANECPSPQFYRPIVVEVTVPGNEDDTVYH